MGEESRENYDVRILPLSWRSWDFTRRTAPLVVFGLAVTFPIAIWMASLSGARAQSSDARPEFEVASIRQDTSCGSGAKAGKIATPGKLDIECITLLNLIRTAYGAYASGSGLSYTRLQITGAPGWIDSDQYDVLAKANGNAAFAMMAGPMLQKLLEDRFKLQVHRETRELAVYTLRVDKGGLKLRSVAEESCKSSGLIQGPAPDRKSTDFCGRMAMKRNGANLIIEAHGMSIADFSRGLLASRLDRPVIDKTGVLGRFDFHLEFNPSIVATGISSQDGTDAAIETRPIENDGPSIFTAVREQLGLKLSPDKGAGEVLVIDHVDKPSAN
jgi:uncharacterized protein (TIGR03435 family)